MRRGFLVCIGKYKLFRERRYAFNARTSATTESIVRLPVTEAVFIAPVYMVVPCRLSVLSVFRSFFGFCHLDHCQEHDSRQFPGKPPPSAPPMMFFFPACALFTGIRNWVKTPAAATRKKAKTQTNTLFSMRFTAFPFLLYTIKGTDGFLFRYQ